MNNRTNSLLNTSYRRNTSVPYDDVHHNTIHVSLISLVPDSTFGVVDPFGPGVYAPPFALAGVTPQPLMQNPTRNTYLHPRPRFATQSQTTVDSLLMGEVQNKGLEKLRKEIYNPGLQRANLYYRNYYDSRTRSRENDDDGKRCAVCLDDFEAREMVTLTPCNHMFHDKCIVPWVRSHGQCPVCRFVISEREETPRTSVGSELGNDPFARDLITFIRDMETRG